MRLPLGSLLLALAAGIFGGWVLIEHAPRLLHAEPRDTTLVATTGSSLPAGPQPRWAVDPAQPGPNLPTEGRSLFDFAMVKQVDGKLAYDIPFPIDALVRKVEDRAGCAGQAACTRQVLIPLGRSLQRIAASPNFFAYPRVVIAVDGEGASGMLLKDRLYIGYQERSNLLEVISYNEQAGRFEFQIVKDYRAGGTPRAVHANRTVCTACHQNLAPLFSRQQWDETNANPAIARQLASAKTSFYGFPARRDIETPNAIDAAIHRANMLSVYQALWREGCGDDPKLGAACRRAALIAALQYRLSGERAFDAADSMARDALFATIAKNTVRWPNGMAIPNSEIPNRDPLTYANGVTGLAMTSVAARFEPLAVRAPLEVWAADGDQMSSRLVAGLAQIFSAQDMKLIDDQLARVANAPLRHVTVKCEVDTVQADVRFRCGSPTTGTALLQGRVSLRGDRVDSGELSAVTLKDEPTLRLLDVGAGQLTRAADNRILTITPSIEGRRARLASGNALDRIELRWRAEQEGEATITVRDDFSVVREAVATLDVNSGLLSARAFGRANVMAALAPPLGIAQSWCCTQTKDLPPALEDVDAGSDADMPAIAEPFKKACGACHRTPEVSPPNFLHGDPQRVSAAVTSCAARIFVRLSMWDVAFDRRDKVPMPPPRAGHDGTPPDHEYAPKTETLESLKAAAATILRKETGREPSVQRLLEDGYENLRPCLPAGS